MKIKLRDDANVSYFRRVSYLYIPALFVIVSVLLEVMMFAVMKMPFPRVYIFSLTLLILVAAVIAVFRRKWVQTVFCSLLLGWQLTTTISNIVAYDSCMEIFSLETLKSFGMAFGNTGAVELNMTFLIPTIAILVFYVVGIVLIMWFCRLPKVKRHNRWQPLVCAILAFVSFCSYTIAYAGQPDYQTGADSYVTNLSNQKFLYDTFSNRVSSLRTFGSYSYYLDNFLKLVGGKTTVPDVMDVKVEEEFQANEFALSDDEVLGEGYNLIMVLMETFERTAINPITMPNLYNFMKESCYEVDGYYSIERTCFTDHIGQTGMHEVGKELWNNYGDVTVPHSLANIFDRSGYITSAFHDYAGTSYNREKIFTEQLGFKTFNDFYSYDNQRQKAHCGLNSDEVMFKQNLEKIAPADQNFYSYIISVSTHALSAKHFNVGDYYPELFAYLDANWEALTELYPVLLSEDQHAVLTAKNYLAGTYNFDLGFGALLNRLQTTRGKDGKLLIETTALVMFGDHYNYVYPSALAPENDNPRNLVGNRSPLIVYNPRAKIEGSTMTQGDNAVANIGKEIPARTQTGKTIYRFSSTMDLYPTVCSLFGVVTDQQLTYGHSIFDTNPSLGVSYLSGYTWGALGYTVNPTTGATDWQIWKTLDFVNFNGVTPTQEQITQVTPLVNRTYASIFVDTALYDSDGFKNLAKSKAYHLRAA